MTPPGTLDRDSGTKDATFENVTVGEELGPLRAAVTPQLVRQYAFCLDDHADWHITASPFGPPVAHAALLANDLRAIYDTHYERRTVTGLHTQEELDLLAPAPVGETVTVTGRFADKYVRRGQGYAVIEGEVRDDRGRLLVRRRGVEIMRVQPGDVVGRGSAPTPTDRITPSEPLGAAVHAPVAGLAPGTPVGPPLRKQITQAQMSVYSFVAEHEHNFHNDRDMAVRAGLNGTIAQGLHVAGYLSEFGTRFFGANWFTSGRLRTKFLRPVRAGSHLTVAGRVATQEPEPPAFRTHLELWVQDPDGAPTMVAWASAATTL